MSVNIDRPPLYNPITKDAGSKMPKDPVSDEWSSWFSTFMETLQGYLTQFGMLIPVVTNAQRASIQSPVNGQMVYNSDTGTFQGFQAGAWKTFTLT